MSRKKQDATPDSPTQDPSTTNGEATTAVLEPPAETPKKAKKSPPASPPADSGSTAPPPTEEKVALNRLNLGEGTQMRPRIDDRRVVELREVLERAATLDPIRVWKTPVGLVPSDGFHRIQRAIEDGDKSIPALVFVGTVRDAIKDACSANSVGPMPRDFATKKNAVRALLADPEWSMNTVGWIAETAAVSKHIAHEMYQEHHEQKAKEAAKRGEKYDWPKELKDRKGVARPAPTPRSEKPTRPESSSERTTNATQDDPFAEDVDEDFEPGADADEVSDSARLEADPKPPVPKAVDPSRPVEISDEEWIGTLKRGDEAPLIELLPVGKRKGYLTDAVRYRTVWLHPEVVEAGRIIMAAAKPPTGDSSITGIAIRTFWGLTHPKEWKLCVACQGKGTHVDGGPCQADGCNGNGYRKY
jgi:hypothetical protein